MPAFTLAYGRPFEQRAFQRVLAEVRPWGSLAEMRDHRILSFATAGFRLDQHRSTPTSSVYLPPRHWASCLPVQTCDEAREWAERQSPDDPQRAWVNCPRPDWMLWLLDYTGHDLQPLLTAAPRLWTEGIEAKHFVAANGHRCQWAFCNARIAVDHTRLHRSSILRLFPEHPL